MSSRLQTGLKEAYSLGTNGTGSYQIEKEGQEAMIEMVTDLVTIILFLVGIWIICKFLNKLDL